MASRGNMCKLSQKARAYVIFLEVFTDSATPAASIYHISLAAHSMGPTPPRVLLDPAACSRRSANMLHILNKPICENKERNLKHQTVTCLLAIARAPLTLQEQYNTMI